MIAKDILIEAGKRKGLSTKDHIEKDYLQDLTLSAIFKKTNMLVFKGGTALYKFYGLPRFSEDLDFSVIGESADARAIVADFAKTLPCNIREIKQTKGSLIAKLEFEGVLTLRNTIRIDITLNNKVLQGFDVKQYTPDYIDINPFYARVMKPEEIIAEKIHALLARDKARDLYDLFFLLRMSAFNKDLALRKLGMFGMDMKQLRRRIDDAASLWVKELRPFVLAELPDYNAVRNFVIEKLTNSASPQ